MPDSPPHHIKNIAITAILAILWRDHIRRGGHRFESNPRYYKGYWKQYPFFVKLIFSCTMFTVYALYSPRFDKIYIGFTANLEQRILSHNELGKKGWTIKYRPWTLLHTETFQSKAEAMKREKELKTGKGREFLRTLINA